MLTRFKFNIQVFDFFGEKIQKIFNLVFIFYYWAFSLDFEMTHAFLW